MKTSRVWRSPMGANKLVQCAFTILVISNLMLSQVIAATAATAAAATSNQVQSVTQQAQQNTDRQAAGNAGQDDEYLIGVGIADITGPSADINLVSFLRQLVANSGELFVTNSSPARWSSLSPSSSRVVAQSRNWACQQKPQVSRSFQESLESCQLKRKTTRTRPHLWKLISKTTRANKKQATISLDDRPLMNLQYPSWRDLQNVKLQLKMGYAKPNQDAGGIHLRQFSRSLIIEDSLGHRVVYINLDNGMISQLLRTRLLARLASEFPAAAAAGEQTSSIYNESNVMLSATHTHSCPGGFFQYMLYNIPSAGFIAQTLDALVEGVVRSVKRAQASMQPGSIYLAKGELLEASINRSPTSYANNPAEERARYEHDTDKTMWLLRFNDRQGRPVAALNWFAVHGTSMNNTNHLISSDNKGYAALLLERDFNPANSLPGQSNQFVALFAQANEGDVSPNTRGPRCLDSGLPCESASSTCGTPPRNEKCVASGPGRDMFESTQMIAHKQYFKARELLLDTRAHVQLRGPVRFVHEHIDITQQQVPLYDSVVALHNRQPTTTRLRRQQLDPTSGAPIPLNSSYQTCVAGLGYSFAAGTTDGPGAFDFTQGDTVSTRYWNMVRDFLRRPSEQQTKCHYPKPILLSTGEMDFPYMWHPKVVPTQIFMIGQVAIVALPGEFTTMAGRRVRQAVQQVLENNLQQLDDESVANATSAFDLSTDEARRAVQRFRAAKRRETQSTTTRNQQKVNVEVVLSGLSNVYTSYITTIEEYEMQRYEGASTLYGPHTLQAYINQFKRLASFLTPTRASPPLDPTLQPPDLTKSLFTLKPGVVYDGAPHGKQFGDVLSQVDSSRLWKCRDLVSVSFVAGNPRNDLRQESSFLYVDKFDANSRNWQPVASDASWETKFIWERTNTLFGESKATIEWAIPDQCQPGVYRIRHLGAHKTLLQTVSQYAGKSAPFQVYAPGAVVTQEQLEAELRLAEQVEALQSSVAAAEATAASKRNYDHQASSPSSIFTLPLRFMSSILHWKW